MATSDNADKKAKVLDNTGSWKGSIVPLEWRHVRTVVEDIVNSFLAEQQTFPKEVFLLFGPPGSGKSSVAEHICELRKFEKIIVGRQVCNEVLKTFDGKLVAAEVLRTMIRELVSSKSEGAVLDGYLKTPRQVRPLQVLQEVLQSKGLEFTLHFVHFQLSKQTSVTRQLSRGENQSADTILSSDLSASAAATRYDKNKSKIESIYSRLTAVHHYQVHDIDAELPLEEVKADIGKTVSSLKGKDEARHFGAVPDLIHSWLEDECVRAHQRAASQIGNIILGIFNQKPAKKRNSTRPQKIRCPLPGTLDHKAKRKLQEHKYWVTDKTDGVRQFLMIHRGSAYFVSRRLEIKYLPFVTSKQDMCLDGELVLDHRSGNVLFLPFDIASFSRSKLTSREQLPDRLRVLENAVKQVQSDARLQIKMKTHYPMSAFEAISKRIEFVGDDCVFKGEGGRYTGCDGFIWTSERGWYIPPRAWEAPMLKWKFPHMQSIDFEIQLPISEGPIPLYLVSKESERVVFCESNLTNEEVSILKGMIPNGKDSIIAECVFRKGQWVPSKLRLDKANPNYEPHCASIIALTKNPFSLKDLVSYSLEASSMQVSSQSRREVARPSNDKRDPTRRSDALNWRRQPSDNIQRNPRDRRDFGMQPQNSRPLPFGKQHPRGRRDFGMQPQHLPLGKQDVRQNHSQRPKSPMGRPAGVAWIVFGKIQDLRPLAQHIGIPLDPQKEIQKLVVVPIEMLSKGTEYFLLAKQKEMLEENILSLAKNVFKGKRVELELSPSLLALIFNFKELQIELKSLRDQNLYAALAIEFDMSRAQRYNPIDLTVPSGKSNQGETPQQAVLREIREEFGLDLFPTALKKSFHHRKQVHHVGTHVFLVSLEGQNLMFCKIKKLNEVQQKAPEKEKSVQEHYNSLHHTIEKRNNSATLHSRNLHNAVKLLLISSFVPTGSSIVDLCCGQGGDMYRYSHRRAKSVAFVDIAEKSLEIAKNRLKGVRKRFKATFIHSDAANPELLEKCEGGDVVTCMFALHYFAESVQKMTQFLTNVSNLLPEGGVFIGTCPDRRVLLRLRERSKSVDVGGGRLVHIDFLQDKGDLGDPYIFSMKDTVDNVREWMVDLEKDVSQLAAKVGLTLETHVNFQKYVTSASKRKMNLLRKRMRFDERGRIPQPEWDICNLYCVFVFRKGK